MLEVCCRFGGENEKFLGNLEGKIKILDYFLAVVV
jgi:hypothetical protein